MQPHPQVSFWEAKLIWAILVRFGQNLSKIEAKFGQKLNGFGQNQNLAFPKTIDFLRL